MATSQKPQKKPGKKKAPAKTQITIHAVLSEALHLTLQEKRALAKALKAAGETYVECLEEKYDESIPVAANFEE